MRKLTILLQHLRISSLQILASISREFFRNSESIGCCSTSCCCIVHTIWGCHILKATEDILNKNCISWKELITSFHLIGSNCQRFEQIQVMAPSTFSLSILARNRLTTLNLLVSFIKITLNFQTYLTTVQISLLQRVLLENI